MNVGVPRAGSAISHGASALLHRLLPAIAIVALLFADPVLGAEPQAVQLTESIPEQSLDSALRELARITHLQILYVAQLTAHRRSGGHVSAGMTAAEALAGLLSGTGLAL